MSDLFVPRVGGVLSADIAVPEHEREARFYACVLGTGREPLWRADDLMNNLGLPIIGLGRAARSTRTCRSSGCPTFRSPLWRPASSVRSRWAGAC